MFSLLLLLAVPSADACGLSGKSHVVGWNKTGDHVLLRLETESDEGTINEIELAAFDLAKRTKVKGWVILAPEDEGDRNKRGARWKAAEKEIAAMGIEVMPEVPAFEPVKHERYGTGWQLPSTPAFLRLERETYDEGMMQRYDLVVRQGDARRSLGVVHDGSNSACGGYYPTAWKSPSNQYLLLLDQSYFSLEPTVISATDLSL